MNTQAFVERRKNGRGSYGDQIKWLQAQIAQSRLQRPFRNLGKNVIHVEFRRNVNVLLQVGVA